MLFSWWNRWSEKQRNELIQKDLCPDCSGRGFFLSGFEAYYVLECTTCDGSGKSVPE